MYEYGEEGFGSLNHFLQNKVGNGLIQIPLWVIYITSKNLYYNIKDHKLKAQHAKDFSKGLNVTSHMYKIKQMLTKFPKLCSEFTNFTRSRLLCIKTMRKKKTNTIKPNTYIFINPPLTFQALYMHVSVKWHNGNNMIGTEEPHQRNKANSKNNIENNQDSNRFHENEKCYHQNKHDYKQISFKLYISQVAQSGCYILQVGVGH